MTMHMEAKSQKTLCGRSVFLSASIPDPERWQGGFDAFEVTDAVVAAARSVLAFDGVLVTAAHPTIAPLLLYVAAEFPPRDDGYSIIVYQSDLFEEVLPEPTQRFKREGIGDLRWTDRVPGDVPTPGRWDNSLASMRRQMLVETDPIGAVFVGGMAGILTEFELYRELFPTRPVYPVGRPGGEARALAQQVESRVPRLVDGEIYPVLFRHIVSDLAEQERA